jgi:hypothetical protein
MTLSNRQAAYRFIAGDIAFIQRLLDKDDITIAKAKALLETSVMEAKAMFLADDRVEVQTSIDRKGRIFFSLPL